MEDQISSEKDAAILSPCERNQSLFMEMMHQQNLLLRASQDERADVSTNKKVIKSISIDISYFICMSRIVKL